MCNYRQAKEQAVALGAVKVGHYYTISRLEKNREIFSSHFFDTDGLEVGLYNHHLGDLSTMPLTVMEPRRGWGPEALATLTMESFMNEVVSESAPKQKP